MPVKPKEHYIAGFGAKQWTGRPAKGVGALFWGSGFLTFIASLFLMIYVEPLRNVLAIVGLCTLVATVVMVSSIAVKAKRENAFLAGLTRRVNDAVLELTGDPTARIEVGVLRHMIQDNRRRVPLQINGVPGVVLTVVAGKENEPTRVVAVLTTPDYGLESFDVLLNAERQRKQ